MKKLKQIDVPFTPEAFMLPDGIEVDANIIDCALIEFSSGYQDIRFVYETETDQKGGYPRWFKIIQPHGDISNPEMDEMMRTPRFICKASSHSNKRAYLYEYVDFRWLEDEEENKMRKLSDL